MTEEPEASIVADVIRTLPFDRPNPFAAPATAVVGRMPGGWQPSPPEPHQPTAGSRDGRRVRESKRGVARQHGDHRPGDQDGENSAGTRATGSRRAAFGAVRPRGAGAARMASCPGGNGARENQVCHVRAGDDEHQRRRRKQDEQHRSGGEMIWSRSLTASIESARAVYPQGAA